MGQEKGEKFMSYLYVKRSEEHTSELQSQSNLVCRLLLEKKKKLRDLIARSRLLLYQNPPSLVSTSKLGSVVVRLCDPHRRSVGLLRQICQSRDLLHSAM